ncbi:MAG: phenylalanine--tRNA ligase subunit beta [Candidatus Magasanikbacteria bacterium]|nr:phenylalanine--tRNA ligase subunit beta [Candidatus Magasanikbacteria bacterium]
MKLSFNWLKQYVNLPDSVSALEVAEKLKMATVEVEEIDRQDALLDNVVIGKVLKVEKHPEADKLKLCEVDIKNEKLQIVCGGSNVREGMLVALAKVGAKVKWHGQEDLLELKPTAIRGVESFGMICSASEIGLDTFFPAKEQKEIIDLTGRISEKQVGKPLADALELNDVIFDIDNKSLSHRPDLWGHYGMAREVAVLFGKSLKEYGAVKIKEPKKDFFGLKVEVKDKKLCPRYMAAVLRGVKVEESPNWLKAKLISAGFRPINNIVDITNYVLLDLGQPMHAFDMEQLAGNKEQLAKIIVRRAESGEMIKLLDENVIELVSEDLIIADAEKPLALAGVMGGEHSGITEKTTTIIFESANFNASSIRKSSTRHGLRTDSSARFEKSLDPNWCEIALNKAVELAHKFCATAELADKISDISDFTLAVGPIVMQKNIFEKKLGEKIPEKEITKILTGLGFKVSAQSDKWAVEIPTWRATKDVSGAEDLIEEVARIWGYEQIASAMPEFGITAPEKNKLSALEHDLRDIFAGSFSFDEVYNYSFVSPSQIERLGDKGEYTELDNPLSKEKPYLRRSLLPNMMENAVKNIEFFDTVRIFEIGKVFWPDMAGARVDSNGSELLPRQDTYLSALYCEKKDEAPFSAVRRSVERMGEVLNLDFKINALSHVAPWMHPTRAGEIICDGIFVGVIYEVNPFIAKKFGLDCRVSFLEINLETLVEIGEKAKKATYRKVPDFPSVVRDLAFVVDGDITHAQVEECLKSIDPLVESVELFDVYIGDAVSEGEKSMAYRLTLSRPDKTLSSSEVDAVLIKAGSALKKKFGAEVRR